MLAVSVCLSQCESYSVDSVDMFSWCHSYSHSSPSSVDFLSFKGKDSMETFNIDSAYYLIMGLSIHLHLLLERVSLTITRQDTYL